VDDGAPARCHALVRVEQLCLSPRSQTALDLEICPGDRIGILGGAGSGKTALLRTLARLQAPVQGGVWWNGRDVTRTARWMLGKRRAFVTLVSTNPYTSLEPWAAARRFFSPVRQSLPALFRQGGLPPSAVDSDVRAFSGVQRLRLALLCALQHQPRVVLVDDVFRMLVPEVWDRILAELDAWAGDTRALVLASRFRQALRTVDVVCVLDAGQMDGSIYPFDTLIF